MNWVNHSLSSYHVEVDLEILTPPCEIIRKERVKIRMTTHLSHDKSATTMRDVAQQIQHHFYPEYNDKDFEFRANNTKLKYHCSVSDAKLEPGGVLKVNVVQHSKLTLHPEAPFHIRYCICQQADCHRLESRVWGANFNVNTETLYTRSAHRQGGRTPVSQITASLQYTDLIGLDAKHLLASLKEQSGSEWFWNCYKCDKHAIVCTEECVPQDKNGRLWEIANLHREVLCGECLVKWRSRRPTLTVA